jgi:NurA-like 5'-3' nuclease
MDKAEAALQDLVTLTRRHSKNNMLMQFALSRKTQNLIDEASASFTEAIAKLQLGLTVSQIGVNLRIDENVTVLMRYVCYYRIFWRVSKNFT